jgi:hypothetical protein
VRAVAIIGTAEVGIVGAAEMMLFNAGVVVAISGVAGLVGRIIERVTHRDEPTITDPNRETNAR